MLNFLKQLEGRRYNDDFGNEYIIAEVKGYIDGTMSFYVHPINDAGSLIRFEFDELCIDFEEWV